MNARLITSEGSVDATAKVQRITDALRAVVTECGLTGESGTETFVGWLKDSMPAIQRQIDKSHDDGLCIDCCWLLATVLACRAG